MRVSNSMQFNSAINNLYTTQNYLNNMANQAYSNKRVSKPSDDPYSISSIITFRKNIQSNDQYKKNVEEISGYLDAADSSLLDVSSLLQRTKELLVQASSETLDQVALNNIADEIKQLRDQIGSIANTKHGNKYIFGGISINTPPYGGNPANWQLPNDAMKDVLIDVDSTTSIPVTLKGNVIFNGDGVSRNIFDMFDDIVNDLNTSNFDSIRSRLDEVDTSIDQVLSSISIVGARSSRLEVIASKLDDSETILKDCLSKKEDVDIKEAIVKLTEAEYAYKVSLSITDKILNINILDYMSM